MGKPAFHPIYNDDLNFKTWNEVIKPDSKAVVIAMMDTSGSMGNLGKIYGKQFLLLDDTLFTNEI